MIAVLANSVIVNRPVIASAWAVLQLRIVGTIGRLPRVLRCSSLIPVALLLITSQPINSTSWPVHFSLSRPVGLSALCGVPCLYVPEITYM